MADQKVNVGLITKIIDLLRAKQDAQALGPMAFGPDGQPLPPPSSQPTPDMVGTGMAAEAGDDLANARKRQMAAMGL